MKAAQRSPPSSNSKPTVLFIALGYSGKGLSGGDIAWLRLAKELTISGYRIGVLTSIEGKEAYLKYGLRADFIVVNQNTVEFKGYLVAMVMMINRVLVAIRELRRAFIGKPLVIVSTSDLIQENIPLLFAHRDSKIAIFSIFHMVYPLRVTHSKLKSFSALWSMLYAVMYFQQYLSVKVMTRTCDKIIAHSNAVGFLQCSHVPRSKIIGVPLHWVNVDSDFVRSIKVTNKSYDAIWVGRYSPRKGFEDLVEVWTIIRRRKKDAKLALVGSICYDSKAMGLVRERRLEGIDFKGFVTEEEKIKLIKSSRIFLHTSYLEGQPTTAWEALLCGVPIVCYDTPFNKRLVGAIRIPPNRIEAFAQACLNLLSDPNEIDLLTIDLSEYETGFRPQDLATILDQLIKHKLG